MNKIKSGWLEETKQIKMLKKYAKEQSLPLAVIQPPELKGEYYIKFLEYLGFKEIKINGEQVYCKFPLGWKKSITYLSNNFLYLIDNQSRKRATIFYKFLGNFNPETDIELLEENINLPIQKKLIKISTYINWLPRYTIAIRHRIKFPNKKNNTPSKLEEYYNSPIYGCIVDNATNKNIYETLDYILPEKYIYNKDNTKYFLIEKNYRESLYYECLEFLNANYPEHNNILKY